MDIFFKTNFWDELMFCVHSNEVLGIRGLRQPRVDEKLLIVTSIKEFVEQELTLSTLQQGY